MYPERAGLNLLPLSLPVQDGEQEGDDCRAEPEDAHVSEVVCSGGSAVHKKAGDDVLKTCGGIRC